MKYLGRLVVYLAVFLLTFSVGYTVLLRFLPVTVTPLKVLRWFENLPGEGVTVDSQWERLRGINMSMVRAVMASEDNNFLVHRGFDWEAIDKALEHNRAGKRVRGASTITQQTAKNVFCLPSRTWFRKGIEAYYTVLIETLWGKRRIMEVYLNVIETGPNVYGVGAAARKYFDKTAGELNAYDASMIAAVLPNPLRMRLAAPSSYVVRRSATIRRLMRALPPVDFDNPVPPTSSKRK
ncbi:MAG: monofunctional biosynthetic peptidoglycan transglycosylase [Rikenellaceae bacterium]|nr:monofunctional biosynthetic peptidoglycan transglycosylase [Rikenellaceae bacterium]